MIKNQDNDNDMPITFPKKYAKTLKEIPEFQGTADSSDTDELKKIIIESEGNIFTIEKEKEEDIKLNAAKDLVKDLSQSYRDAMKIQTVKVKYALFLLESRGVNLNNI